MFKFIKNQKGLAVDEAILASIMVASLGAFVFVNVPWGNVLGNSSQLANSLEQIEMANKEFYERHRMWPHQTTSGDWRMNVNALVSPQAMRYPYNTITSFKNYIYDLSPKFSKNGVRHELGEGGSILQRPITWQGEQYLEIILEDVPVADARTLDKKVDGEHSPEKGRVTIRFNDLKETASVHYLANQVTGRNI